MTPKVISINPNVRAPERAWADISTFLLLAFCIRAGKDVWTVLPCAQCAIDEVYAQQNENKWPELGQEIIGDEVLQKEKEAEYYQENAPTDNRFVVSRRILRKAAGLDTLAIFEFRRTIGVEHGENEKSKSAKSEDAVNLFTHHHQ